MSLTVFLDSGPLGFLSHPAPSPQAASCQMWAVNMMIAGHRFIVPAIADFEVRRELERSNKVTGLSALDAWNAAYPDRYLPLSDSALKLGASLWARARNMGRTTADPKELDADVLMAAQALDLRLPDSEYVIATSNVGHLSLFARAELWTDIAP